MVQELSEIFKNISERKIYRILLSIKMRNNRYGVIGISRKESTKYGLSERQMQRFINYLREVGALDKIDMVKGFNNAFKCNIYSVSKWFIEGLKEVKDFIKKVFKYIDPLEFVKTRFNYKIKYNKLIFSYNNNKYIVHLRGRFSNKIYGISEKKIISPTYFSL